MSLTVTTNLQITREYHTECPSRLSITNDPFFILNVPNTVQYDTI